MLSPRQYILLCDCVAQLQEFINKNSISWALHEEEKKNNKELQQAEITSIMNFGRKSRTATGC